MKAEPRVLLPDERERPKSGSLKPAPEVAWRLVAWVGLAFVVVGGLDLGLTWVPFQLGNPEWEFGTVSATLDGLPLPALGLTLIVGWAAADGRRWVLRGAAAVLAAMAICVVAAGVVYATDVPLALKSAPNPTVALGLKKAIAKAGGQMVVYPVAFAWLAVKAWRHSAGPKMA